MARLTEIPEIRARLCADSAWSAYALCDLAPAVLPKTQWFVPDLTLVLHDYGTCILFSMGTGSLGEALAHVTWPCHLQVRQDSFEVLASLLHVTDDRVMWRMRWHGRREQQPRDVHSARRLGSADVPALQRLYADGDATGEAPDFFMPSTVTDGVFFGVYEGDDLVAAAGTHVLSREEGAAAIGNVYTRRDRRSLGLARAVTGAVLGALDGVGTIVLNVRVDNAAALRVYESLGFERHCQYHEALARGVAVQTGGR